jgi:thioredoxin 1
MSQKTEAVTAADWDREVIGASGPVLVDFQAAWCPPCRAIAREVDAVAEQMRGRARVFTLDVDAEPDLAARYGVQKIPTLLVFKDGAVADTLHGFKPRSVIAERLEAHQ